MRQEAEDAEGREALKVGNGAQVYLFD